MSGYVSRSFDYLNSNDFMNVFVESNEAIKFDPKSPITHYLAGVALISMLDFNGAAEQFSESLKLDPTSADAHFMLAQAYRLSGRFDEALNEYQDTLKRKPEFAAARALVGECYRMQGAFWKAKTECAEAMRIDPQLPLPHTILAESYLLQDQVEPCLSEYQSALQLTPNDPYVHFRYGQALGKLKRWADAETEMRKAIELDPKYADAMLGLSGILFGEDKLDDALHCSMKAVSLAPNDVDTHRVLAQFYSIKGEHDLSAQEFKIAFGLKPKSLGLQRALALELAKTQNIDEAIVELSLVIKQLPLDEELKLAFNALLQLKNKEREAKTD